MPIAARRVDCGAGQYPVGWSEERIGLAGARPTVPDARRKTPAFARPLLAHPLVASVNFRRLFLGDVLVKVAERYFALTFVWWMLAGPHANGARLGVLLTLESLAILVVGAFVGPFIDRSNKKLCMAASALLQCLVVAGVAVLVAVDALSFPRLCAAAIVLGALLPVFEGAAAAALPQAVVAAQLSRAAALQSMTVEFSNVIAAALAAVVLSMSGFVVASAINAVLYASAALFLLRLPGDVFASTTEQRSYLADLKAGLAYIISRPSLTAFVGIYVGELFLIVPLLVLIPMLVQSVRAGAVGWVAILETCFSFGAIVTAIVLSLGDARRRLYRRSTLALLVLAAAMFVLVRIKYPSAMVPDVIVMGSCVAVLMGLANVLFQEAVPDQMKGRFFGVVETLGAAATPLGYALVGLAFGWAGVSGVLIGTGFGLVLLAACVVAAPPVLVTRIRYSLAADGFRSDAP